MKPLPIINHPTCPNFCSTMKVKDGRYGRFFYCQTCSATSNITSSHIKWPKDQRSYAKVWTGGELTYASGSKS